MADRQPTVAIVLLDKDGKELERKGVAFAAPELAKQAYEQFTRRMQLFRDRQADK